MSLRMLFVGCLVSLHLGVASASDNLKPLVFGKISGMAAASCPRCQLVPPGEMTPCTHDCECTWQPMCHEEGQVNVTDYGWEEAPDSYYVKIEVPEGMFEEVRLLKQECDREGRQHYRVVWVRRSTDDKEAPVAPTSLTLRLKGENCQPVVLRIGQLSQPGCVADGGFAYCIGKCKCKDEILKKTFRNCQQTCDGNLWAK